MDGMTSSRALLRRTDRRAGRVKCVSAVAPLRAVGVRPWVAGGDGTARAHRCITTMRASGKLCKRERKYIACSGVLRVQWDAGAQLD